MQYAGHGSHGSMRRIEDALARRTPMLDSHRELAAEKKDLA